MSGEALQPPDGPIVSVVVVSYNGQDHLDECLTSLCRSSLDGDLEVWVIDNGSTDESCALVERFASSHSCVQLLRSETNLGYAGGVNEALPHVRGRYVAVLNQDMVVETDWLVPSVALLDERASVGAVSPMMVLYDDDQCINSVGQNVHVTGLGFNRWLGRARADAGVDVFPVSGLHGGAFVIRRSILERLGGWDASGFLYHEDVELSWLLHLIGCEIFCAPSSAVKHKYHLTMHPEKLFLLERNRWHMLCCNLAPLSFLLLAPLLICSEGLMWGYCLLRGPRFLHAKLRACAAVLKGARAIRERRCWIKSIRTRTDWRVLRCLKWTYAWDQFITLGKEKGSHVRR